MTRTHRYAITTSWTGNRGSGTSTYRAYGRDHDLDADGRPTLAASADPVFRGDEDRWNPELLLVAALSACHLLAYLHLCAVNGVVVTGYRDQATGMMEQAADGGRFTEVVLRPVVTVAEPSMIEPANALHHAAHDSCFIAASVAFEVRCEPAATAWSASNQQPTDVPEDAAQPDHDHPGLEPEPAEDHGRGYQHRGRQ